MSSHHVVREKQEPALYIHYLGNFEEELLGQLLEWSPTVIVDEQEYDRVSSFGIKIDIVVAGGDTLPLQEHIIVLNPREDSISAVMQHLLEKGYPALNIIANGRGEGIWETYGGAINIVWFNPLEKTFRVRSGFSIWKTKGTVFFTTGTVETTNLEKVGPDMYRVVADGFVSFSFNTPYLLITEQL